MTNLYAVVRWTIALLLLPFLVTLFTGCGAGWVDEESELVFVNDAAAEITCVGVDTPDESGGTLHADSSPLRRGETFGFSVDAWPATVTVYQDDQARTALASLTVPEAPPSDGRWYVTATDGPAGLELTASTQQP